MRRLLSLLLAIVPTLSMAAPLKATFDAISAAYKRKDYGEVVRLYEATPPPTGDAARSRYWISIRYHYAIALDDMRRHCAAWTQYETLRKDGSTSHLPALETRLAYRRGQLVPKLKGRAVVACEKRMAIDTTVDEQSVAGCTATFEDLAPGEKTAWVTVNGIGFRPIEFEIEPCGESRIPIPKTGTVRWVDVPQGSDVFLYERRIGSANEALTVPPGQFTFELRAPGFTPRTYTIEVEAGESRELSMSERPSTPILPWIALGTSAAVTAIGGYFFVQHLSDSDAQDTAQSAYLAETNLGRAAILRAELLDAKAAADDSGAKALWFGAAGAAGLIGSAVWVWMATRDGPAPTTSVHFDGRRLTVGGTW